MRRTKRDAGVRVVQCSVSRTVALPRAAPRLQQRRRHGCAERFRQRGVMAQGARRRKHAWKAAWCGGDGDAPLSSTQMPAPSPNTRATEVGYSKFYALCRSRRAQQGVDEYTGAELGEERNHREGGPTKHAEATMRMLRAHPHGDRTRRSPVVRVEGGPKRMASVAQPRLGKKRVCTHTRKSGPRPHRVHAAGNFSQRRVMAHGHGVLGLQILL